MAVTAKVVSMVKSTFIDGVTFDYESPIANGAPEAEMYVQIINETTKVRAAPEVAHVQLWCCGAVLAACSTRHSADQ